MEDIKKRLRLYKNNPLSLILFVLVILSTVFTIGILLFLIGYIMFKGIPNIRLDLFEWEYNSVNVSLMPALITQFYNDNFFIDCNPIGIFFFNLLN